MHSRAVVQRVLDLLATETPVAEVARRLDVPRRTVRDWKSGALPSSWRDRQRSIFDPSALPAAYAYLLGLYHIRAIFCRACDELGLRWTTAPHPVYVSRKLDVARLDEFIGPKC